MTDKPRGQASSRPTLEDVARLAGVSLMTASRAIRDEKYVSASAREKVLAASSELGFVPHQGARNLATNRAGTIGLIAPMADARFFTDPNIAAMVSGANAALSERGSQMVVLIAGNDAESERVGRYVQARHVDGAILLSPEIIRSTVDDLHKSKVPLVGTGTLPDFPWLDSVVVDTRAAVATIVGLLRDAGARSIAVVSGPRGEPSTVDQLAGYSDAIGAPATMHDYGDYSQASGRDAADRLLDSFPSIDAIFAASDVMALGVLEALASRGRSVPGDVLLAGYDDSIPALSFAPGLTTVRVPFHEIGRRMAELLLDRLESPDAPRRSVTVDVSIVRRETA